MNKQQMKWAGIGLLIALAALLVYPSVSWYRATPEERSALEHAREMPKFLLNLGLDLRGGTHLLMEMDTAKLDPKEDLNDAANRAIEVIRNRIDQFGVAEPFIARQGLKWIVVQLPGVKDPDQAKALLNQTALLEFRMVDESEAPRKALEKAAELGGAFQADKKTVKPEVAKLIPQGDVLLTGKEASFYVCKSSVPLTGAHLKNARVETGGQMGLPVVGFTFDEQGGQIFDLLTAANIGHRLAVTLDGVVYSAPVIKSRIGGGSGIIEGNFSMEDARNLAIVLRAGALPVPLHIIEERTVGPSIGDDSIKAGLKASLIGLILVVGFMIMYYHASGGVSVVALFLNLLFLLAGMAYLRSTLTLPGIAGIILTIGMAVDTNVLIFERIREELRHAKPIRIAVDAGYSRAFTAIFDTHVTTLISAAFLFQFGTGTIKGFAVTLSLGLLINLFTAVVVTRAIFDSFLAKGNVQRLSI